MKRKEVRPQTPGAKKYAAIDVGSNSIHMVIVEVDTHGKWHILQSMKEGARLAASLNENLLLDAQAVQKVAGILKEMKLAADGMSAEITAFATQACREAKNGMDFCLKIQKKTGIRLQIISGNEEARLIYLGIQSGLPIHDKNTLVVDIGGGSAEILLGQWGEERFSTSLKLGAVRLTKRYLKCDPVRDAEIMELKEYIVTRLEPVLWEVKRLGFDTAVASSGTAKAVKVVARGLAGEKDEGFDIHGKKLTCDEIDAVVAKLLEKPGLKERREIPYLDPKRAEILLAGALVLQSLTQMAGVKEWVLSAHGLREGMVQDVLNRERLWLNGSLSDVRWRSVKDLAQRMRVDTASSWHVTSLAISIFVQLQKRHRLGSEWREYLRAACYLYECGRSISYTSYHRHSSYVIRHSDVLGFTQDELNIISNIVRYHRKRGPRLDDECFGALTACDQKGVTFCCAVLRLATCLDMGRQGKIQEVHLTESGPQLMRIDVALRSDQDIFLEMRRCSEELPEIELGLGMKLHLGAAQSSAVAAGGQMLPARQ